MGHLAVSFMSITLCVMSHIGGVARKKAAEYWAVMGEGAVGFIVWQYLPSTLEIEKSGGPSERGPVIYQA